jgi:hypothetical protein
MEIKGALTMTRDEEREMRDEGRDDLRYYNECPLRKGHPRIAITICHKQKCLWLATDGGKMKCGYAMPTGRHGDPNASK